MLVNVKIVKSCLNEILDCVEAIGDDGDDYFEDEGVADNAEVYVSFGVEVIGTFLQLCNEVDDLWKNNFAHFLKVGDGGGGGGISLAGTWWDEEALRIAEVVSLSFDGDLKIYAFKTMSNYTIQVRIEKLSNK